MAVDRSQDLDGGARPVRAASRLASVGTGAVVSISGNAAHAMVVAENTLPRAFMSTPITVDGGGREYQLAHDPFVRLCFTGAREVDSWDAREAGSVPHGRRAHRRVQWPPACESRIPSTLTEPSVIANENSYRPVA